MALPRFPCENNNTQPQCTLVESDPLKKCLQAGSPAVPCLSPRLPLHGCSLFVLLYTKCNPALQYCAKVMQTNFDDFRAFFSQNFAEISERFESLQNEIRRQRNFVITKIRGCEILRISELSKIPRLRNFADFRTSEILRIFAVASEISNHWNSNKRKTKVEISTCNYYKGDKGMFTRNLFYHLLRAHEWLDF